MLDNQFWIALYVCSAILVGGVTVINSPDQNIERVIGNAILAPLKIVSYLLFCVWVGIRGIILD